MKAFFEKKELGSLYLNELMLKNRLILESELTPLKEISPK